MHRSWSPCVPRVASLLVGVAALTTACTDEATGPDRAAPSERRTTLSRPAATPRQIVRYAAGRAEPTAAELAAAGARLVGRLPHLHAVVVDRVRSVDRLRQLAGVQAVLPSLEAQLDPLTPVALEAAPGARPSGTDQSGASFFARGIQWNMRVIDVQPLWALSDGGAGARACIIDSGADETHQELVGKVEKRRSWIPNDDGSPQAGVVDTSGHGTHVASTVTSNGLGLASPAPDTRLYIAKVFDGSGGGATTDRVLAAVRWCADEGADVINMSLGFNGGIPVAGNEDFIAFYQQGLDYATSRGVLIVSSSGNDNRQLPYGGRIWLPAQATGVLNVGATAPVTDNTRGGWPNVRGDTYDNKAFYSNYGAAVDLFAPGGRGSIPLSYLPRRQGSNFDFILGACASASIPACATGDRYIFYAGTSMASPHVAGVATVLAAGISGGPASGVGERIRQCLLQSAASIGPTTTFGPHGRLDASAAWSRLQSGGC